MFFTDVHLLTPTCSARCTAVGRGMAVLTNSAATSAPALIGLERRLEHGPPRRETICRRSNSGNSSPSSRGQQLQGDGTAPGSVASTAASLMKLGITEMMFETSMLRSDLAGMEATLEGPMRSGCSPPQAAASLTAPARCNATSSANDCSSLPEPKG
ncbi:MAG: hypothetical protein H6514_14060 [Acidimicrobiaceae bacterium]|nr:hypothetical protein [Acidimicrobiaceae bacterium]